MKFVNVNVDWMQVFVTINNVETKINASVNSKNWLIKVYAIKDLFGIKVIANVNVINRVILVSIWTMEIASVEKKVVDKKVEECTETNNEVKLAKIILAHCTLCYFR